MVKKGRIAPKVAQTEEKRPPGKTYSLSKVELNNLGNRASLRENYQYIASLIEKDMQNYVDLVIRKRLNIPMDVTPQISFQEGKIFVPDLPKKASESKLKEVKPVKTGAKEKKK